MRPPARVMPATAPTTPPPGGVVLSALAITLLLALGGCTTHLFEPGVVTIGAVQGDGATSPLLGEQVTVEAVVSARMPGLGGVFVQDPAGDGDLATADGVFVVWPHGAHADGLPAAGARLRIEGTVVELGEQAGATQTALELARFDVLGSGAPPPARLLTQGAPAWEALEGMRVRVEVPLTVTGNHALLRHGELQVAFGGRVWHPTELHPPGPLAQAQAAADRARTLLLDDAHLGSRPATLWQLPQPLSAGHPLRIGSHIAGVEGVLEQREGGWRLQPTAVFGQIEQAPRPPAPSTEAPLRLVVFNVLNFFDGDGRGGGFPTERGANSAEELIRQRDKLVAALRAMDADIVGLLEIENDGSGVGSSLATLTAALNAAEPTAPYTFVPTPAPGESPIRVALLYRPDRVTPVGRTAQIARGPFADGSRPPLVQAFAIGDGAPLVVAVNHFKSKSCRGASGSNADQRDHQACWNAARTEAASSLAEWLAQDPTGTGSDRVLVVGDLNAHTHEDPLRVLATHGYRDVFAELGQLPEYSYVFQGRSGRLDHALASAAALPLLRSAAVWHANADESEAFDYSLEQRAGDRWYRPDPWRASDHDPLLIGLDRSPR